MALRIELEPFDIEDKARCSHVIAILVPLFKSYYEEHCQVDDPEFNFNFMEFVKDWWHGDKVLLLAYEDDTVVGFLYAKRGGNLFTSLPELRIKLLYVDEARLSLVSNKIGVVDDTDVRYSMQSVVKGLKEYAQQLLPLFQCVRLVE